MASIFIMWNTHTHTNKEENKRKRGRREEKFPTTDNWLEELLKSREEKERLVVW